MHSIIPASISLFLGIQVKSIFISLIFLSSFSTSFAETKYISDQIEIAMRSGQGTKFSIRKMLTSASPLTVLQSNKNYTRVQTEDGTKGWVLTRHLSDEGSARLLLEESKKKVAELESAITNSQREISGLTAQNNSAGNTNESLQQTAERLKQELGELRLTAASAVSLSNENSQLKIKIQEIDRVLQAVTIENNTLKGNDHKRWFLIGAAVLFSGIFLGLVLPRLRVQRKQGYSSF